MCPELKFYVFWDMPPCRFVSSYGVLRGAACRHLWGVNRHMQLFTVFLYFGVLFIVPETECQACDAHSCHAHQKKIIWKTEFNLDSVRTAL